MIALHNLKDPSRGHPFRPAPGVRTRSDLPGHPAISKATAYFLVETKLSRLSVMKSLDRGRKMHAFLSDLDYLAGQSRGNGGALLINYVHDDVARLHVSRPEFSYCELRGRDARLFIAGYSLPETCCAQLSGAGCRLSEVMEDPAMPFYLKADPEIVVVDNKPGVLGPGLIFWLKVERLSTNWRLVP